MRPDDTSPPTSLAELRNEYARASLDERDVLPDPIREFERWLEQAMRAELVEPTAMTLATASPDGAPSARIVLLKGLDERGFVFFTDYRSQKGAELDANPRGALVFFWKELERQVRVTGTVARTGRDESEAYYRTRPLPSRLGAWASHQSRPIADRAWLEERLREATARYAGSEPPLPPHWGGYRLTPATVEFWQGRPSRLHDRIRYVRDGERWRIERLAP